MLTSGAFVAAALAGESAASARPLGPGVVVCSVFSRHPCAPTTCSVFRRRPCTPEFAPPIGEDLRVTIESRDGDQAQSASSDKPVDTIRGMFAALRACWVPPREDEARAGMQMSVRFAFKRDGDLVAKPRVTYATRGAEAQVRDVYLRAIDDALQRCTPMPFSSGMGGAIAGRPIAVRFVDNRPLPNQQEHP